VNAEPFAPDFRISIDGSALAPSVARYVTDLSVVTEPDTLNQFSLTVANPYPEMPWTHGEDAALFGEGRGIKIELGYAGDLRPVFDGEITSISPSFPESGSPTVRLEGYTRLHRLKGSPRTRTFRDVTDTEIAQRIAQDLGGLDVDADQSGETHPYVIQYNQTDLAFLMERARRIHFDVRVEGKTLVFKKAAEAETASHTLVWGHAQRTFAPGARIFPLKSFTPTMNTLRPVNEVIVRGVHPQTREPIEGKAGTSALEAVMGSEAGSDVAVRAFGARREEVRVDQPVASRGEAEALARAIFNARALQFVSGSGSSIGIPDLQAGVVVELDGLGARFNGPYYVTQATHTVTGGGYSTSFAVRSNAVG
jgi:uncharacterized protein